MHNHCKNQEENRGPGHFGGPDSKHNRKEEEGPEKGTQCQKLLTVCLTQSVCSRSWKHTGPADEAETSFKSDIQVYYF